MSASAEPVNEAKKKKGKLPVILLLIVVLGAGGFFGMRMKGGPPPKKPEIKLGEIVSIDEFLLNLRDGKTYLRTQIAFHVKEGFKKEELDRALPAVRDTIIAVLTSKSIGEVSTVKGKEQLKTQIAESVNSVLEELAPEAAPSTKVKEVTVDNEGKSQKSSAPKNLAWQSDTGPVLKVYFTSFATQ
jgi:flagellar FliL protein